MKILAIPLFALAFILALARDGGSSVAEQEGTPVGYRG
jgi:hypothetical protein